MAKIPKRAGHWLGAILVALSAGASSAAAQSRTWQDYGAGDPDDDQPPRGRYSRRYDAPRYYDPGDERTGGNERYDRYDRRDDEDAAGPAGDGSWPGDADEPGYERQRARRHALRRYEDDPGYRRPDDWPGDGEDQPQRRPLPSPPPDARRPDTGTSNGISNGRYTGTHPAPVSDDGGPQPYIAPMAPPVVAFAYGYAPGTIVVDTGGRALYYVMNRGRAYRYPISVGREGFAWTGTEKVSRIADWPDWLPPAEMRQRRPELPERMSGGIRNPLGARAIYLGNTLYRIHGTNDPKSIGRAESSGCIRMLNPHAVHLGSLVSVGTEVHVVRALSRVAARNMW